MTAISPYQLFALMVLFQFGTTVIFGFSAQAGRDAWLSGIISAIAGALLVSGYALITRRTAYCSLTGWYRLRLGKWIGTPVAWMYPLLFIYDAGRVLADLRFLVPLTLLPQTPAWFFISAFLAVTVYVLFAGIEVLGRIAGVLLPVLIVFIVLESLLLWASGSLHGMYMKPVLGEGFGRVADSLWPIGITQTYGESIELAAFWFMLNRRSELIKVAASASLFAGLFIVLFNVLSITALGEDLFQELIFPAFTILKLSSIADFLENLDALGALYFMCTAFIKISVHLLAAVHCICELSHTSRRGPVIWAAAVLAYVIALTMADNFASHLQAGIEVLPYTLWVPLFIVLPMLVLALSWLGERFARRAPT